MKFKYGNSWEKYPIEHGQVWEEKQTNSLVSVCDITTAIPEYMMHADMIYSDPPWNQGNVNSFYTKAGKTDYINDFSEFYSSLFAYIAKTKPKCCYLEIGKQHKDLFQNELLKIFPAVQFWQITYYKKHPCFLLRGGNLEYKEYDFHNKDDEETPFMAIQYENPCIIADPCTGRGLTALASFKSGKKFIGTELNKRRLAVTIERVNKIGGKYENSVS